MGYSRWWFSLFLSPELEAELTPRFARALAAAVLTPEMEAAIRYVDDHPVGWDFREIGRLNASMQALDLPGFVAFAEEVACLLTEETAFRFLSINKDSPIGLLRQAIGPAAADRLPGRHGNLLVPAREVDATLSAVDQILGPIPVDAAVERIRERGGLDPQLRELITHLPDGLRAARDRGTGFLALARPQL